MKPHCVKLLIHFFCSRWNWVLFAFLGFTHTLLAAPACYDVLSVKLSAEQIQQQGVEVSNLASLYASQFRSYRGILEKPALTENDRQLKQGIVEALTLAYKNYTQALEKHLNDLNVSFEWRDTYESLGLKEIGLPNQTLYILPGKTSYMNRLAAGLQKNYSVGLIYDPVALRKSSVMGAFSWSTKSLLLPDVTAHMLRPNSDNLSTTDHELWHMAYFATRLGKESDKTLHPVHMSIDTPLLTVPLLSFEEFVTYGISMRVMAGSIKRDPSKLKLHAETLKTGIHHLRQFADFADLKIQEVRSNINTVEFKDGLIGEMPEIQIWRKDKKLISLFLLKGDRTLFEKNKKAYILKRFEAAEKMVHFTRDYFKNMDLEKPLDVSRLYEFHNEQRAFLESLEPLKID